MRTGFIAILALVFALTGYVCWHLWRMAPSGWKLAVTGLFVLWMATMFAGFACTERVPVKVATVLYEVGNTWMIAFLYLLLVFIVADIASLCHLLPKTLLKDSAAGLLGTTGIVALILTLGAIHYPHKYREELTLETDKPLAKPLTIGLASDLHIGYHNRRSELARWIDLLNAEHADMILIAGDIIDGSMRPLLEERMAEEFQRLNAPVYACLGNHEYYAGDHDAEQFYHDAGIHLLRDSVVLVDGIAIIGRDDRTNMRRKSVKELMGAQSSILNSQFSVLLDHQPYHLDRTAAAGIDFQFSGHTHHGQVWPISWITESIYECAFGEYQRDNTRFYVSSGLGIWGGKFRIGTRSEYVVATVRN